ncbi:MAG: hypothetical protein ACD_4C00393G0007 [uncultured bacterium (gcode 4)]|uniref:Methyltransferase type 11 n=1 Tax=uncultured bacterium (gcode 4) TaxID=1234023 RepID=K2FWE3_9BACT|nr:MAG: hypothetical protein ACD_4C00393G0007 [uncultured bacterium (gcode 4)]
MKKNILDYLICPDCKSEKIILDRDFLSNTNEIINATLKCNQCSQIFPIIEEILIFSPKSLRDIDFEKIQIWYTNDTDFSRYYSSKNLNFKKDISRIENKEMEFWDDIQYLKEPKKNWFRYLSRKNLFDYVKQGKNNILELGAWFWQDMFENIDKFRNSNHYISTDLSYNALRWIKKRSKSNCIKINLSLIVCIAWDPPFKKELFDYIIVFWVLLQIPELHAAIPVIFEKMKSNWLLLLNEPKERKSLLGKVFRKTFVLFWLKESIHSFRLDFDKLNDELNKVWHIDFFIGETSPIVPLLWLTIMRNFWENQRNTILMQKIDRFMINTVWKLFSETFWYWEWLFVVRKKNNLFL